MTDEEQSYSDNEGDFEEAKIEDIIFLYSQKKWKARWCIVCDGILLMKKEDNLPGGKEKSLQLGGSQVVVVEPQHKKDFVFQVTTHENEVYLFSTSDETGLNTWVEALSVEKDKPIVTIESKKKQSKFMRDKKNVGGKIATSSVGKKIIREMIGKDGVKLLSIIKTVIGALHGKEKAKETEKDIIRIRVKVILIYRNDNITMDDFTKLKPRLQRLWHICQDYSNIINFDYNPKSIQEHSNNFFFSSTRNP